MFRLITCKRVIVASLLVVAIGGGAATIEAYAGGSRNTAKAQLSPRLGALPMIAGTRSQVLATLASRLPLVTNPAATPETVPPAPDPGAPGTAVSGVEVLCDLTVNSTGGSAITKALWERDLFVGAVADEFAAQGLGTVIDANATLVTPDGTREAIGGGVSAGVPTNQLFDPIPPDISSAVASTAASIGLHSVKVTTMQVLQDALVVQAVSDSPKTDIAAFKERGGLEFLLGQPPTNFEGVYLEIDDSSGNPVYITDTAPRDGGGGWWADPSLGDQGDNPLG